MAAKELKLPVSVREPAGTAVVKRLRASGITPAVVYSRGAETVALQADTATLKPLLNAPHIITLEFSDNREPRYAVVSEVQRHFMTGLILHVDFHEVHMGEEMTATVPIAHEGHPKGEMDGGILEQNLHEVEIVCLPKDLPEEIMVDVSGMELNDRITLEDLKLPEGVKLNVEDLSTLVLTVAPQLAEEEESEDDAAAEPEVISKGKQEDESEDSGK